MPTEVGNRWMQQEVRRLREQLQTRGAQEADARLKISQLQYELGHRTPTMDPSEHVSLLDAGMLNLLVLEALFLLHS